MTILYLPTYVVFIGIFIVSIIVAVAGCALIKKYNLNDLLLIKQEVLSITYPIVGLVYGVLLAFTIVIVWGQYLDAEESVTHEVAHLSELWRNGQAFPDCERSVLQERMINYVTAVIEEMGKQKTEENHKSTHIKSTVVYETIWKFFYQYKPETEQQKYFYTQALVQINELGQQRRLRLMYSQAEIHPTLWIFLLGGGVITIGFVFIVGTKNNRIKILVTTLLTGLILSSMYLVSTFQHPFEGDVSIDSEPYIMLLKSFEHRKSESNMITGKQDAELCDKLQD